MKKKNKRLKSLLFFLVPLFTGTALIFYNLKDNMVFFYSPTEILNRSDDIESVIRLGGMVKKGSVSKENTLFNGTDVQEVSFIITDFENEIEVKYIGILPDLFKEEQGVVVQGNIDKMKVMRATEVLAKHDENYMPPEIEEIQSIKEKIHNASNAGG